MAVLAAWTAVEREAGAGETLAVMAEGVVATTAKLGAARGGTEAEEMGDTVAV
jgi:hypothetical protein